MSTSSTFTRRPLPRCPSLVLRESCRDLRWRCSCPASPRSPRCTTSRRLWGGGGTRYSLGALVTSGVHVKHFMGYVLSFFIISMRCGCLIEMLHNLIRWSHDEWKWEGTTKHASRNKNYENVRTGHGCWLSAASSPTSWCAVALVPECSGTLM